MAHFEIGIDPGMTGGLAVFQVSAKDGIQLVKSMRMPVEDSNRCKAKKTKRISSEVLADTLAVFAPRMVHIELVNAMPARDKAGNTIQGISSTFNFGFSTGSIESVIHAFAIPITYTVPSVWKKHYALLKTQKIDAVHKANEYWPEHNFTRAVDSGRADAALIGLYGILKFKGELSEKN